MKSFCWCWFQKTVKFCWWWFQKTEFWMRLRCLINKEKQNAPRERNFHSITNLEMPEGYHPSTSFILQMGKPMKREHILCSERQGEQPWRMRKRSWLVVSDHSKRSVPKDFSPSLELFFSLYFCSSLLSEAGHGWCDILVPCNHVTHQAYSRHPCLHTHSRRRQVWLARGSL